MRIRYVYEIAEIYLFPEVTGYNITEHRYVDNTHLGGDDLAYIASSRMQPSQRSIKGVKSVIDWCIVQNAGSRYEVKYVKLHDGNSVSIPLMTDNDWMLLALLRYD